MTMTTMMRKVVVGVLLCTGLLVSLPHTCSWGVTAQSPGCNLTGKVQVLLSCCPTFRTLCCYAPNGQCYCSTSALSSVSPNCSKTPAPDPSFSTVSAANDQRCCGNVSTERVVRPCYLFGSCSYTFYRYTPSAFEQQKMCTRVNPVVEKYWNRRLRYRPYPSPGNCTCKAAAATCFPANTTTTTNTTKTTTTVKPTVKPKPKQLCPTPTALSPTSRMLGGAPESDACKGSGVLSFTVGGSPLCNGVLGFNPTAKANQIYITDFCKGYIQAFAQATKSSIGFTLNGKFQTIDVSKATALGNQISTLAPGTGLKANPACKTSSACVYNKSTMKDVISFNSCSIKSIGYDSKVNSELTSSRQVQEVKVTKQTKATCTSTAKTPAAECFTTPTAGVQACWGDSGAPVYCQLTSTNETVLYGMLDTTGAVLFQKQDKVSPGVCQSTKEFHVVPLP